MKKIHLMQLALCMFLGLSLYGENLQKEPLVTVETSGTQETEALPKPQEETLYLPDLVTIIGGEDWQVSQEALPDYQLQLPVPPSVSVPPSVAEASLQAVEGDPVSELPPSVVELATVKEAKQFFVEGFIEPAWPLSLDTEFSVFTVDPQAFFLDFGYKTVGGYGLEQAEDGFFHNKSFLQLGKNFVVGGGRLQLQGNYQALDNGLQGQSLLFDDINRRGAGASLQLELPVGKGFSLAGGLPVDWYNRYAGFSNTVGRAEENGAVAASLLGFSPWLSFAWESRNWNTKNTRALPTNHEFSVQLLMDWGYWASLDPQINSTQNRGSLSLSGSWLWNSQLEIFSSLGLVYLPSGSGEQNTKLLVPFALGLNWNEKEASAESFPGMSFSVEGGLDSHHRNFYQLEARSPYVNFSPRALISNGEVSDWFFKAGSSLPLKLQETPLLGLFQELFLQLAVEYRQSAFGNTVLVGDYATGIDSWTGLFPSKLEDRKALFSQMAVTAVVSNFLFKAGWNSQWLYHPVYEPSQRLVLSCGYDSPRHPWGGELKADFGFRLPDSLPILGAQVYFQPAENLRLAVKVKDMLKLFSGSQRVFVEPYMKEAGSVALSLQFNF